MQVDFVLNLEGILALCSSCSAGGQSVIPGVKMKFLYEQVLYYTLVEMTTLAIPADW